MVNGTPTREQLRTEGGGEGLSFQELVSGGLSTREAQTRLAGFQGAFGGGRASQFREERGLEINEQGQLVPANIPITELAQQQVLNPQLAGGTALQPITQQVQAGEVQAFTPLGQGQVVSAQPDVTAQQIQAAQAAAAAQVSQADVVGGVQAQTIAPTLTSPVETLDPARLNVSDDALVENRLAGLFADIESGVVPPWAKAAHNTAQEQLAARGIGASSIGAGAIALALMQSALPIAAQDAQTFFQADLQNFQADQQSRLVNFQARQQNMLTDVAIDNAAEQFNASSKQQTQQFVSTMINQIQTTNASLINNVEQFNASQENAIAAQNAGNELAAQKFNRQLDTQIDQFNSELQNNRDQFNSQMRFAVDQSNVSWRRNVNTANTASANAANQVNVQNRFNMSQVAQNNLWQQWRDEAAWLFEASENQANRDYNLAMSAGNREFSSRNDDADFWSSIGTWGRSLVSDLIGF